MNLTRLRYRGWSANDEPLALATEARWKPAVAGTGEHAGEVRGSV